MTNNRLCDSVLLVVLELLLKSIIIVEIKSCDQQIISFALFKDYHVSLFFEEQMNASFALVRLIPYFYALAVLTLGRITAVALDESTNPSNSFTSPEIGNSFTSSSIVFAGRMEKRLFFTTFHRIVLHVDPGTFVIRMTFDEINFKNFRPVRLT